jgi:hypothetical protein
VDRFLWTEEDPFGDVCGVYFFRGLGPEEVLSRFDPLSSVEPTTLAGTGERARAVSEVPYVAAAEVGAWTVAVAPDDARAAPEVAELSWATEVVAVMRHDYAEDRFVYTTDGAVVAGFIAWQPEISGGDDPERLNEPMRRVGLLPDPPDASVSHAVPRMFALAAEITGVAFTPAVLDGVPFHGATVSARRRAGSRARSTEIRQWAKLHGSPVADRGRISFSDLSAWEERRKPGALGDAPGSDQDCD